MNFSEIYLHCHFVMRKIFLAQLAKAEKNNKFQWNAIYFEPKIKHAVLYLIIVIPGILKFQNKMNEFMHDTHIEMLFIEEFFVKKNNNNINSLNFLYK